MKRFWRAVANALWYLAEKAEARAEPIMATYVWVEYGYDENEEDGAGCLRCGIPAPKIYKDA